MSDRFLIKDLSEKNVLYNYQRKKYQSNLGDLSIVKTFMLISTCMKIDILSSICRFNIIENIIFGFNVFITLYFYIL